MHFAVLNDDYSPFSFTITIPDNAQAGVSFCTDVTIPVVDDEIVEFTERFSIRISSTDPVVTIGMPNTAVVNINDNDDSELNSVCTGCGLYLVYRDHCQL